MTTTTTIEKLFAHIFDRKCQIINQAKHQAESYGQHLASKLLIDGVAPPPWLWNPRFADASSSEPEEYKKEELLTELLLPHPQPKIANRGGFCSLHNQSIVREGNEDIQAGVFVGTLASNEHFDLEHGPEFISNVNGGEIMFALNVPEQNICAASLQRQIEVGTSDIVTEPTNGEILEGLPFETHVPNIGRNAEDKLTPLPESNYRNAGSSFAFAPELDQSIISPQGQNETRISTNVSVRDQSLSRLQRSKSRQKALELRKTVEKAVKTNQADTNVSGVYYNGEKIFSNASNQRKAHQDDESLAPVAHAIDESLSKAKDANPADIGRKTRSRSSCILFIDDSKPKLDNAVDVAEIDSGRTIRSQNNCVEGKLKHVHVSNASTQRVTRSKSDPSRKLPVNYFNSHKKCPSQKAPGTEFILCRPDNDDITEPKAKTDALTGADVILVGPVEPEAAWLESKLDGAGPSVGLQGFDSKPSSKSRMIVKPKTLEFDEMGKINLFEASSPMEQKETLDKSLQKRDDSSKSPASLDKIISSNCCSKSIEKQSAGEKISNQITESWKDSYETCLEKHDVDEQVPESTMTKNVEDNSDIDGKLHNSPVFHGEPTRSSNAGEDGDTLMYLEKEEADSIPKQQLQTGELVCNQMVRDDATCVSSFINNPNACQASSSKWPKANDRTTSTPDSTWCDVEEYQNGMDIEIGVDGGLASSDSMLLQEKSSVSDDGSLACDDVESLCLDDKNFTSDEIRELKFLEDSSKQGKKLRPAADNTWPRLKRRKIERHNKGWSSNYRNVNTVGPNLVTALQFESISSSHRRNAAESYASKSPDIELHPNILIEETGPLPEMPVEQDGERISFATSSLSREDATNYKSSFGLNDRTADATLTFLDENTQGSEKNYKDLVHFENDVPMQNKDELAHYGRTLLETKPYDVDDGFHLSFSVASPQDLGTSTSDQTMPEFEGFIIGGEDSGQRHIVGDSFDHLNLPTNSAERASLLEQLCKSAVMHTPRFQFSSANMFHGTPHVYQSASNGALEHLDPKITSNLNGDGFEQLGASDISVDELEDDSQGLFPDGIPFSATYYGQSLNPPISPVSKLWGRISSQSSSSEKKLSSNPELTCFPIEEDPIISEEQEDKEEGTNSSQEDICSALMDCADKRNPLTDITQVNVNPHPSDSAAKKSRDSSSLDSVDAEINFTGAHGGVKKKLGKRTSSKRIDTYETKKTTLSASTNFSGIAKESLHNGSSKPNLSRKTSLRKGGQSVSGRESKRNNIVSNISSFVPFVQQKQAAAVITGKRDVKVKALEAAEAAKRLEERKENERKLKKEALKLERAKQEQENLLQAKLKIRKKEDELKKKEADVAARKRLREEEEKKEKERKRRRFDGKRQQQKVQEEKLRTRKLEKKLPVSVKDVKLNSGALIANALQKPQKDKVDVDKVDGNKVKKPDTHFVASKSLENDVRQTVVEVFEACGHSRVSTEVTNTSRVKSYEMSPYQSSDDEDDDEVSPRKFVPAWASKKSLALVVSSQQDVDPDILFAPESFCSVDEGNLTLHLFNFLKDLNSKTYFVSPFLLILKYISLSSTVSGLGVYKKK